MVIERHSNRPPHYESQAPLLRSETIIRTHKDLPTNKREPGFEATNGDACHWSNAKQTRELKMSNENQGNLNQDFTHQQNGKEQVDTGTASNNTIPGSFQAIVTAYGDYSKKSFEDTKSFVERLSGVRSLDKAIEIQTEFARTAYKTFVTESQKIGGLYGDLAQQSYKPFGSIGTKMFPRNL
jgi:hypothetical protein